MGGNVDGTVAGENFLTPNGVTIGGYTDLAGRLPAQASQLYGQNLVNLMKLLTPGKVEQVVVDCWSTSIIFNRGHRIRATVTSSCYPRFDVNPGTGQPWSDAGAKVKQTNRVYCGGEQASCLLLPVAKTQ